MSNTMAAAVPASVNARGEVAIYVDGLTDAAVSLRPDGVAWQLDCENGNAFRLEMDRYPSDALRAAGQALLVELSLDGRPVRTSRVKVGR